MKVVYDKVKDGVRILRCFGYDGQVELPDRIGGLAVTELGPYAFSELVRRQTPGEKYLVEVTGGQTDGACRMTERTMASVWMEAWPMKGRPVTARP